MSPSFAQDLPKLYYFPDLKDLSSYKATAFVPTLESPIKSDKNAIYCATLLFAWNDIRDNVKSLEVPSSQKALKALDDSRSYEGVLKKYEYKVKTEISKNSIVAEASFVKALAFEKEFESYPDRFHFKGKNVPAFGMHGSAEKKIKDQVEVLYYKDDENFVIELSPKNKMHKIVLFKSSKSFKSMAKMHQQVQKLTKGYEPLSYFGWRDMMMIPKFAFNIKHRFNTLIGSQCRVDQKPFAITEAIQTNAFMLNERGAKIKSSAVIGMTGSAAGGNYVEPKRLLLDKDFYLMMRRTDADNPYFSMFVTNTELMTSKK